MPRCWRTAIALPSLMLWLRQVQVLAAAHVLPIQGNLAGIVQGVFSVKGVRPLLLCQRSAVVGGGRVRVSKACHMQAELARSPSI